MPLKFAYNSDTEIPAEHKTLYKQVDGKWILDVEDAVPKSRLDEFRTNNVGLQKQVTDLQARYKDVDPDDYRNLVAIRSELEEKKLKGTDAEKIIEQRVGAVKKDLEAKLTAMTGERDSLSASLAKATINDAVIPIALGHKLRQTAIADLVSRVSSVFRLKEGKPTAFDGDNVIYGPTGDPLTLEDYVKQLVTKAPHLFEASQGGGASNTGNGGGTGGVNPWTKEHWNLTKQAEIVKKDRATADRMAQAAGKKIG